MVGGAGNVASRTLERCGEPKSDRVSNQGGDNRDCGRRGSGGACWRTTVRCDDIDAHAHELGGKTREPVELSFGETSFDHDVGTLHIPKARESFFQLIDVIEVRSSVEECADPVDLRGLLRLRDASGQGSRKREQCRHGKWPRVHVYITPRSSTPHEVTSHCDTRLGDCFPTTGLIVMSNPR